MFNKYNFEVMKGGDANYRYANVLLSPRFSVCTDGYKLLLITTPKNYSEDDYPRDLNGSEPQKNFEPIHIDFEAAEKLRKAIPKLKTHSELDACLSHVVLEKNENGRAVFGSTDLTTYQHVTVRKKEERYPDVIKAIKGIVKERKKKSLTIGVNPRYLANLLLAIDKCDTQYVELRIGKKDEAIELKAKTATGQSIYGLLMPRKRGE